MDEIIVKQPAQRIVAPEAFERVAALVLNTVSERTRRDYRRAIMDFLAWHRDTQQEGFTRAVVQAHISALQVRGVTDSSINQRLGVLRKLAKEAFYNNLIDSSTRIGIAEIDKIELRGKKLANWLTHKEVDQMLNAPDTSLKGRRDRAILAVMIGCGLRRNEVCSLTVEHLRIHQGRWVIADLLGKKKRTRSVPMAGQIKAVIDRWLAESGIKTGPLFRPVLKGGTIVDKPLTPQAIWYIVKECAVVDRLAPHDLRRTFAKLAKQDGAPLEQIQKSMGHESIKTTEKYVNEDQDFKKAPSDYIRINIRNV